MWTISKTKKERKEKVRQLLISSDKAVLRGIVAIYKMQTAQEQNSDATLEHNNQGFCAFDASTMSLYAKTIIRYGGLTQSQLKIARPKILRYTRQLSELAELYERQKLNQNT